MLLLQLDGRKKYNRCLLCGDVLTHKKAIYCKGHKVSKIEDRNYRRFMRAIEKKEIIPSDDCRLRQLQSITYNLIYDLNKLKKAAKSPTADGLTLMSKGLVTALGTMEEVLKELDDRGAEDGKHIKR